MLKTMQKYGFTLVELMVVVVIVGVLATIAIGMYREIAEKAKYSQARILLKRIYQALEEFYADYGCYPKDKLPDEAPEGLVNEYLDEWPKSSRDPFGAVYDYEAHNDPEGGKWIGVTYLGKDKKHSLSFNYWRSHGAPGVIVEMDTNDDLHMVVATRVQVCNE